MRDNVKKLEGHQISEGRKLEKLNIADIKHGLLEICFKMSRIRRSQICLWPFYIRGKFASKLVRRGVCLRLARVLNYLHCLILNFRRLFCVEDF